MSDQQAETPATAATTFDTEPIVRRQRPPPKGAGRGAVIGTASAARRPTTEAIDAEQERRAILRATRIALWAWPSFHLLDIFMIAALYPAAGYGRCLFLRAAGQLLLLIVFVLGRRPQTSPSLLRSAHMTSYAAMGFAISLMALQFGGVHSAYMHGISIVVLGRSILVPARFGRALIQSTITIGFFPLVMTLAALTPSSGIAWGDRHSLALFASNFVFPVGSTLVSAFCSEVAWAAQRQIYRARRIGRYRLEAPIGRGGMGEMWLARDDALERRVALKLLRSTEEHPVSLARFEREACAASQLSDPHTIRIFDFGGTDDGIHFIAMEYLVGADLDSIVKTFGPLPASRTIHLMRQACASLIESHAAGIIHRDIKPGNLFVARIGAEPDFLKVLDFGIARVTTAEGHGTLTATDFIPGTPAFMAPEIRLGRTAGARSDIFSLGATMHFLLRGRPPLDPQSLPDGSAWAGSPRLQAIVECCLQVDPERRFPDVRGLRRALDGCTDVAPWTAENAAEFWRMAQRRADNLD